MNLTDFGIAVQTALIAFVDTSRKTMLGHDWPEEELWDQFENFVRDRGLSVIQKEHEDDIPF